jgi:acyl carrier protein
MERDEIVGIIAKHLAEEIDHVQVDDIEADMTMRDIGANSLDMIEVVSAVMRDIDIKVPRSQLADIDTVGGLADEFLQHVD